MNTLLAFYILAAMLEWTSVAMTAWVSQDCKGSITENPNVTLMPSDSEQANAILQEGKS